MLKRKVSASMRPSTMKVRSKLSNPGQGNGLGESHGDAPTPKTRFNLNDRSCSSPRLKSFPAEQIKRLEPPALQDHQENMDMIRPMLNSGQGDNSAQQSGLQSRPLSFPLPNQNISSMSEQQVPRAYFPANEQVNQSELVISSPMGVALNERPAHRPHVPHADTTLRDQSSRKPVNSNQPTIPPQSVHQTAGLNPSTKERNQHQYRDPWGIENDSMKPSGPGKESTEDRYPGFFRRNVQADRNENNIIDRPIPQGSIKGPNVSNLCPVAEMNLAGWSQPQQINQQHNLNVPNHYGNNYQEEMVRRQFAEASSDMTSPQDVVVDQSQNGHRLVQFGSYSQNPSIGNNRIQPQSYPMNIVSRGNVNPNSTAYYQDFRESGLQNGPNHHQTMHGNWQTQQQHYHQIPNQATNNLHATAIDNQQKKDDVQKKALRFSPAMIRDQEMLVTTMRQQGIPEELMRRQFDLLLAEQRKQLLYLEQLEQGESKISQTVPQGRRVQRKISKIEEDGKPEWMLHITPPRIPYSVIEKMRNDTEANSQNTQNAGKSVVVSTANVPQHYDQMAQEGCGQNWQNIGPSVANQHQTSTVTGHCSGQPPTAYYGHPMQQQLQQQHYMQQATQERLRVGANDRVDGTQRFQRHQQAEKTIEPSSLLKLRLYKEVIRQQKQNNGLQDPETIKEAMEALKNPANRKGLEYLDNLNKKPEKYVSLNGAQDTQEHYTLMNGSAPSQSACQSTKVPSANGLANQRNPGNSLTSSILHQKKMKESQWPEYPRQKTKSTSHDFYKLIAEREDRTVASSVPKDCAKSNSTMPQNLTVENSMASCSMPVESRLESAGQFRGQFNQPLAAFSQSIPLTMAQQMQHQYQTGQMQLYGNPSNCGQANVVNSQPCMNSQSGVPTGEVSHRGNGNVQQQYHNRNNEIQELIMSGGLKYLGRKPEYIPNVSSPSHHGVNPGNYFNPPVPCL